MPKEYIRQQGSLLQYCSVEFPPFGSGKQEVITGPSCLIVSVIFLPECNCFLKLVILLALHCPMVMSFMMNYELCEKSTSFCLF